MTKDMSSSERTAYFNRRAEATAQKYGFKIVVGVQEDHLVER